MLKLGRMHRLTRETFVNPTAMSRQMRDTCWTSALKKISGVTRPPDWRSGYEEGGY